VSKPCSPYRMCRKLVLILGTTGVSMQILAECDPQVKTTILTGLQGLATSLVTAGFQSLESGTSTTGTTTGTTSAPST
jgi:hypothetical protein